MRDSGLITAIDWHEVRTALGYRRGGFDWGSERDRGDLWRALGSVPGRKQAIRGASTITQQVAKNIYLSPSRNPLRKLKEAVTAYRLELALPKRRILELYLNIAELGDGVWGVEAGEPALLPDPRAPPDRCPGRRPGRHPPPLTPTPPTARSACGSARI